MIMIMLLSPEHNSNGGVGDTAGREGVPGSV
jgi:hypothetical protein